MGLEILVVEDERTLAVALRRLLRRAAAEVTIASTLAMARAALRTTTPWSVLLLDQKLPDGDGLSVLEELEGRAAPPVLIATSANLQDSKRSLRLQAYGAVLLPKPFDDADLFIAITSALSGVGSSAAEGVFQLPPPRESGEYPRVLRFGPISLELVSQIVAVSGVTVELQPTQFRILAHLLASPGRPHAVAELVDSALRGAHFDGGANIRFQIHALRRRLGLAGKLIETSPGGYGVGLTPESPEDAPPR